jgi:radical SAM superfamily enzyme YgiQ (UPF0313 family)
VKTPQQIQAWLAANEHRMDLAVQYAGNEPNAARRPWDSASVRWCLTASWPYEAAAGNQSIPAVYKAIHDHDEAFLCDRFYLPATPGDLKLLEKNDIGAFGIESKRPLQDFDVIGSSISYPVLSMSFLKLLTMSGISPRWTDRDANQSPMVLVGGLSYGAPEVLAPVVDCWFLGEVEDEPGNPGIGAVTARISAFKRQGRWTTDRLACYEDLAREFNFLYFPRFIKVTYGYEDRRVGPRRSKQVIGYTSQLDGMRLPLRKRHVKNLDAIKPLDNPPLLYADPAMGSGDLEVARGCPAWCSFCQLTYRQKPYRQRSVPYVIDYAKKLQANMGSTRLAPFSPDLPMYTERRELIAGLLEQVSDEVDAASMRVDDFNADDTFILLQVTGGLDSVSLGVEGNSQRLRDLIGKGTSDADIHEAVTRGIRAGIRKFKLYMISNLPGEDEGDIYRILKLAKDLADIRDSMNQPNVRIVFSWTPLIIEGNTPMQWFAPQPSSRILGDVLEEFRELKIHSKIGSKAEPNKIAFFQLCQRASRDVGEALVDAMLEADQACWGGVPRTFQETLEQKLRLHGFDNGFEDCFDERFKTDMFGWEFIDQGISAELMWRTYQQMRDFAEITDSHTYDMNFGSEYHGAEWTGRCNERCYGKSCGVCDYTDLRYRNNYLRSEDRDVDLSQLKPVDQHSQAIRVRARVHKSAELRMVGNDHWRFLLRRALFRAQEITHTGFAKRSIRFASDEVKYRDWTYGTDYVEFALTRPEADEEIGAFLSEANLHLTDRMTIQGWRRHPVDAVTIRHDVGSIFFSVEVDEDIDLLEQRLSWWNAADDIPMRLKIEGGYFAPPAEVVNAKDYVDDLWLKPDGHRVHLRMLVKGRPNPYNVVAALMGKQSWIGYAKNPAKRIEVFIPTDPQQQDFLRPNCAVCGLGIPITILDDPYHPEFCPRCLDEKEKDR